MCKIKVYNFIADSMTYIFSNNLYFKVDSEETIQQAKATEWTYLNSKRKIY